jgi:hypothetical protein
MRSCDDGEPNELLKGENGGVLLLANILNGESYRELSS